MAITRTQVAAEIPARLMLEALDDDNDGAEDTGVLAQIIANAVLVGGDSDAAVLVLACDAVYRRAGVENAKNPFAERAAALRDGKGGAGVSGDAEYAAPDAKYSLDDLDQL